MKTIQSIITLTLLLGTCLIASAKDKPGKPDRKGPLTAEMLERFDKDDDGKLSQDERIAMREERKTRRDENFKKFDTDGDGTLSDEERKSMKEARKAERIKKFDTDGDGKLSEEERKAMPERRVRPAGPRGSNRKGRPGKGRDSKRQGNQIERPDDSAVE